MSVCVLAWVRESLCVLAWVPASLCASARGHVVLAVAP